MQHDILYIDQLQHSCVTEQIELGDHLDKILIEIIFHYCDKDNSFFVINIIVNFCKSL